MILPRINSTSLILAQTQDEAEPVLPQFFEPVEGIYNLSAVPDGESVIITFDSTDPHRSVILYRSTLPVRQPLDLMNAVLVQSGINSPAVDRPVPGLSWFYTVIYEDEITTGNMSVNPGVNATDSSVTISGGHIAERSMRPIPLPILTLNNITRRSFFLPETFEDVTLSERSLNILQNTRIPQKEPLAMKNPRVFSIDLEAPAGGEESALFQIVSEYFVNLEWDAARDSLQRYLFLPRSGDVEARARFYLGQTLYYTGNYREALMEFISFRSFNSVEANLWIDAVLTALVY